MVHTVITVLTLALVAALIVVLVRYHQRNQIENRRKALQVCEDGLMVALERLQEEPSWRVGLPRTEHQGGWYEVSMSVAEGDTSRLTLQAKGAMGEVVRMQACVLRLFLDNGDSVWVQESIRED